MRPLRLILALSSALVACSGDDERLPIDAMVPPDQGAPIDAPDIDATPPIDVSTVDVDPAAPDAVPAPLPPVIEVVEWMASSMCTPGTASNVDFTITASDPDTPAGMLTYSASAAGCTGTVTGPTGTLVCPNLTTYTGSAVVMDPEGNMDSVPIAIMPCADGSAP